MNIRTIGLIGKDNSPEVTDALLTLLQHLRQVGAGQLTLWVKAESAAAIGAPEVAASFDKIAEVADVVIVIGGDGTMLNAGRRLADHDVPLVGINQGRLGFMTDIARTDMLAASTACWPANLPLTGACCSMRRCGAAAGRFSRPSPSTTSWSTRATSVA